MGSPFPGMDPYLESEMWQEFHDRLANQISAQLMPLVAPKYVALLSKRYVVDRSLAILDAPSNPEEAPQLSVEIRDVAGRRLVTLIEILSPANKVGEGATEYAERRLDLLRTRTHLLEIDLLRGGRRNQLGGEPPESDYYVYLSRVERRPNTQVWTAGLPERLPTVPVPLLDADPDVALDLQAAVDACFSLVGYERLLDYSIRPPPPQLDPKDSAWVDGILQEAGLR
ncbi:MAG: DUF4058 family protein [Planctomycetota bacterium]|nr:DUF4058 family protein [Planctomycetota bacterium]